MGERFGRYRVDRKIGHGGMGVVFAATQLDLGREVALKILSPDLAESEEYRVRFEREAAALAHLDSPHVIQIYDAGEHAGWLYLATQLVHGGDLKEHLSAHGPLPPTTALKVIEDVAEGLEDAHAAGFLHRDVKPANILLRASKRGDLHAYLADLGISRVAGDDQTATKGVIGSWAYMAPERHEGLPATEASDIYSLGCVLWAALTAHQPFDGTDMQVALGHLHQPVPQLGEEHAWITPDLRAELNEILRTSMAKAPAERYETATAFRDALGRVHRLLDVSSTVAVSAVAEERMTESTVPRSPVSSHGEAQVGEVTTPVVPRQRHGDRPAEVKQVDTVVRPDPARSTEESPKPGSPRSRRTLRGVGAAAGALLVVSLLVAMLVRHDASGSDPTRTSRGPVTAATTMPRGKWVLTHQVTRANTPLSYQVFGRVVGQSASSLLTFGPCASSSTCRGAFRAFGVAYTYRWNGTDLLVSPPPETIHPHQCLLPDQRAVDRRSQWNYVSDMHPILMRVMDRGTGGKPTTLAGDALWTVDQAQVRRCRGFTPSHYRLLEHWSLTPGTD